VTHARNTRCRHNALVTAYPRVLPVLLLAMAGLGLVSRKRDPADRRNVLVQRTVEGALFLERLADLIIAKAAALPA